MPYKDLLVVLDTDNATVRRIELATELANRLGAHLIGLYATFVPEPPGRFDQFNATLLSPSYREAEEMAREHSEAVRQVFDDVAARQGVTASGGSPRAPPQILLPFTAATLI